MGKLRSRCGVSSKKSTSVAEISASTKMSGKPGDGAFHERKLKKQATVALQRRSVAAFGQEQNLFTAGGDKPTHFLLYLNKNTFVGEAGALLAAEVRLAHEKMTIVLVHEKDEVEHDGCPHDKILQATPEDMISQGLYRKLAIPCEPDPMRSVSLSLVAKAFGAVPVASMLQNLAKGEARKALRQSMAGRSPVGNRSSVKSCSSIGSSLSDKGSGKEKKKSVTIMIEDSGAGATASASSSGDDNSSSQGRDHMPSIETESVTVDIAQI